MNSFVYKQKGGVAANEDGFTLVEMLVASVISLMLLALVAGILQSQRRTFSLENQLTKMQANGRATIQFVSRAVQNAGFNVTRGKRFLAASDHFLTAVYDEDNDGAIENNEVITFAAANKFSTPDETFSIDPFFDMDGDGSVDNSETRTYNIQMTISSPPYNIYKVIPNVSNSGYTRDRVAQNIDNVIIRYYDRNDSPLPAGVSVDGNGDPIPPYTIPANELQDIRKVEMVVMARTRKPDPRPAFNSSGLYPTGSLAAVGGATTSYSDSYHRETYTANSSPRNLIMAPWGKIAISASPNPITCPTNSTSINVAVLDSEGDAVGSGITVNFNASGGTVGATSASTDSNGEVTTSLTYDWSSPNETVTFSANAVLNISGQNNPVYNAVPISFQTGAGTLTDNFDDGDDVGWTTNGVNWSVVGNEYQTDSNGVGTSLNGCAAWQDYDMTMSLKRSGSMTTNDFAGGVLRFQNNNQYYMVRVFASNPGANEYRLQIVRENSGETVLAQSGFIPFDNGVTYTLRGHVVGNTIQAKIWRAIDPEPGAWTITATDTNYTSGLVGLVTTRTEARFDDVVVAPPV